MPHLHAIFSDYHAACRRGLRLSVHLGSPRSGNCSATGICSLQSLDYVPRQSCAVVLPAYLRLDRPTGRLLLHFDTSAITETARGQHFANDRFRVPCSYRLPSWVVRGLDLPAGVYRIVPGEYPVLGDGVFTTLSVGITTAVTARMRGLGVAA